MKFTLTIDLGNSAMDEPQDVARALDEVAFDLKRNGFVGEGESGLIRDLNGNRVGSWEVTP
jgi:hypothetical protein